MGIGAGSGEGRGQGQGKGQGHGITDSLFGEKKLKVVKIVVVLIIFVFFGLNIAKIVMGAIYLDDCPIQKLIPIYLIVGGVVPFLFATVFSIIEMYLKKDFPDSEEKMGKIRKVLKAIGVIAFKFTIAWLICGSVWVFGNYSDVIDGCGGSGDCCDTSLIKFALAVTIMDWIFYTFIFVGACCCVCCFLLCCKTNEVEP